MSCVGALQAATVGADKASQQSNRASLALTAACPARRLAGLWRPPWYAPSSRYPCLQTPWPELVGKQDPAGRRAACVRGAPVGRQHSKSHTPGSSANGKTKHGDSGNPPRLRPTTESQPTWGRTASHHVQHSALLRAPGSAPAPAATSRPWECPRNVSSSPKRFGRTHLDADQLVAALLESLYHIPHLDCGRSRQHSCINQPASGSWSREKSTADHPTNPPARGERHPVLS